MYPRTYRRIEPEPTLDTAGQEHVLHELASMACGSVACGLQYMSAIDRRDEVVLRRALFGFDPSIQSVEVFGPERRQGRNTIQMVPRLDGDVTGGDRKAAARAQRAMHELFTGGSHLFQQGHISGWGQMSLLCNVSANWDGGFVQVWVNAQEWDSQQHVPKHLHALKALDTRPATRPGFPDHYKNLQVSERAVQSLLTVVTTPLVYKDSVREVLGVGHLPSVLGSLATMDNSFLNEWRHSTRNGISCIL